MHVSALLTHRYMTNRNTCACSQVGIDTWHHENNPQGKTVEMHGNIRSVCLVYDIPERTILILWTM